MPPVNDGGERWKCFEDAYQIYIHGLYVHLPKGLMKRIEKIRMQRFEELEKKTQPKYIVGGTLMNYQNEGMK